MRFFRIQPLQQGGFGERSRRQFGSRPRGYLVPPNLHLEALDFAQKLRALARAFRETGLLPGNLVVAFAELTLERAQSRDVDPVG